MRVEKLFTISFCNLCKYQNFIFVNIKTSFCNLCKYQNFPTNDFLKKMLEPKWWLERCEEVKRELLAYIILRKLQICQKFWIFFKKNWMYVEDNPFHRFPWMVWWSWKSEKVEWISLLHHISGWMKEVCTGWEKWEKGTFSISAPGLQSIRKHGLTEMMTMLNTDTGHYNASSSLPWCVLLNDILEIQTERMGREWKRHSFL